MKYYDHDFRVTALFISLGGLSLLLLWIPAFSLFWVVPPKLALVAMAFVFLLFAWTANYAQKYTLTAIRFTDHAAREPVLYGYLADPRTFKKFRFMPADAGGLFRQGEDMVLGSLKGEKRCPRSDFRVEQIISGGYAYNRLMLYFGPDAVAMEPLWLGPDASRPGDQAACVIWGYYEVRRMIKATT